MAHLDNDTAIQWIIEEAEQTISPANQLILESWKDESESNRQLYEQLVGISSDVELLFVYKSVNLDKAWENVATAIGKTEGSPNLWRWLAVAACMVFGLFVWKNVTNPGTEVIKAGSDKQTIASLPDGSTVRLNRNSSVSYEKRTFMQKRNVKLLAGEAFFTVEKNKDHQFSVSVDDLTVIDLGTSFTILKTDEGIEINVESGTVAVNTGMQDSGKSMRLRAGQSGFYEKRTKQLKNVGQVPLNYFAWVNQTLQYVETPLSQVAMDIERVYGVEIRFRSNELGNRKLSAYFREKSVEQILTIIQESLHLRYEKTEQHYVIFE